MLAVLVRASAGYTNWRDNIISGHQEFAVHSPTPISLDANENAEAALMIVDDRDEPVIKMIVGNVGLGQHVSTDIPAFEIFPRLMMADPPRIHVDNVSNEAPPLAAQVSKWSIGQWLLFSAAINALILGSCWAGGLFE